MLLFESDDDFINAKRFVINNNDNNHECRESLPLNEVATYLYGTEQEIAMLPARNTTNWRKPEDIIRDITSGEIKNAMDMLAATKEKDYYDEDRKISR